ncbi:DUF2213 domain-containing protein [Acinetobacter sp. HY1485]|uniref:DUF2213 domain-containing protein n=1 Tax=Acinetobacter sp. HY1485 TaxID=2970918 RepID=UPI0022B9B47F|nr:DUF2213 domain-containing protein [Acinetobacter sp. HY1485]
MFKKKTKDRHTKDGSNIYTTGKLGRTRETTPEGYLLCRDVPVARIGKLMYGKGEVPITADNTGLIIVERSEDALFNNQTISSFEGKAVTDDHPDDWVSPENWKQLAVGTAQNVRRDENNPDFLIADLLITDKTTIDKVQDGKVEISLGYDADYLEVSKGKGIQSNILGNHVALVESGRCGSRCSIGDSFMPKANQSWLEKQLMKARRTIDEALAEAKDTEDDDDETKDDDEETESSKTGDAAVNRQILKTLKTLDKRMMALEKKKTKDAETSEETKDDDESETKDTDKDTKTEDDVLDAEKADTLSKEGVQNHTGDSLQEVLVRAEILSPGFKTPTFDSANNGNAVLNTKRQVLKQAFTTDAGQTVIKPFIGLNTNFDTLPAHTVDAAFIGASELLKQQNNQRGVRTGVSTKDFGRTPKSVADINASNREFWANRNKGK